MRRDTAQFVIGLQKSSLIVNLQWQKETVFGMTYTENFVMEKPKKK